VIHSFFVPRLRLKQDIVPGMHHHVWFKPLRAAEMEIACAELCGWGHYKMKGILRIVPRREFEQFLQDLNREFAPPEF
jgi:cytochrome c oxidase subunit 2